MITNKENNISQDDLTEYNIFPKLPCQILRRHVFHGVKEENGIQTIKCLACGDKYELHIERRNRIEKSLWEQYQKNKKNINLSHPPSIKTKKKWNPKYLIHRGKKHD